jgi:hypothetical protein
VSPAAVHPVWHFEETHSLVAPWPAPLHTVVQVPQWFGSLVRFEHVVPQSVWPEAQLVPQA